MDKKLIAVAAASALALPMSASAVDVSVSGHIARIIQHVDGPGEPAPGPQWQHKDAGVSGSRFRITGNEDLENGVTVGVNLEYAAGDKGSSPTLRHSALNFSGGFGSIAFGHTGPTTNGTNDDMSASGLAVDMACSDAVKDGVSTSSSVCTDFTASRRGVVKYTAPAIGALGVSGSFARDFGDVQVSASGDLGGGSYALRASFANFGEDADGSYKDGDIFSAAAAFKVGGISASTLWGSMNPETGTDTDGFGVKLGYDFGDSGVGVLYRQLDMEDSSAPEPSAWGLGVQHNMGAVEFWAGYYVTDHDTAADDTSTFNVGSRIKF